MKSLPLCLLPLVLIVVTPTTSAADIAKAAIAEAVKAGFTEVERQLIKKYLGDQYVEVQSEDSSPKKPKNKKAKKGKKGLPPGLAKKDKLPPGLAKQLKKNDALPPGLAKRNLSRDLERRLRPIPEDYERHVIEGVAIVLIHKATGKIIDIVLGEILE